MNKIRETSRLRAFWSSLRIDRFEINRWPALASHLMAFFLGVVSLNQAQNKADGPKATEYRSILIRPSAAMEQQMMTGGTLSPMDIVITKGDEECRVNRGVLFPVRIGGEIFVKLIDVQPQELASLIKYLLGDNRRDVHFSTHEPSLKSCDTKPKVRYD